MNCEIGLERIPDFSELEVKMQAGGAGVCPVDWTKNVIRIAREVTCGKSVTCRDGLTQMLMIADDITSSQSMATDVELLKTVAAYVASDTGCKAAQKAAEITLKSLSVYAEEWDAHCKRRKCRAMVCKSYFHVVCFPEKCQGCTACMKVCPAGAIAGGDGLICVVDQNKCIRCGKCIEACPHDARGKVGDVMPKLPEAPVPVGSFSTAAEAPKKRRRVSHTR